MTPQALRQRYGIQPLLDAGYDGRGQTAVLIEFKQSVDLDTLAEWQACVGVNGPPVTQKAMPGEHVPPPPSPCGNPSEPACFGEAQGDAYSIVTGAPGLDRLYVIVSTASEQDALAGIVDGLRTGELTDGRRPDVVSLSFGECQSGWPPDRVTATEQALERLSASGTWFFKAAGDAGPSDCSPHPVCNEADAGPEMGYPAASPWVIAVGGTVIPGGSASRPDGEPVVWNERHLSPHATDNCAAGGGGLSQFATPGYQASVPGGLVLERRGLPDVSALAGPPGYLQLSSGGQWFGNGGTSMAAPLYAAAFASVRTKLLAEHATPPVSLTDALYAIAADPTDYATVFEDVTSGDNRIYDRVACCTAAPGYDLASGLGEIRIDRAADALAIVGLLPTTTTAPPPTTEPSTPLTAASVPTALPVAPTFTG